MLFIAIDIQEENIKLLLKVQDKTEAQNEAGIFFKACAHA